MGGNLTAFLHSRSLIVTTGFRLSIVYLPMIRTDLSSEVAVLKARDYQPDYLDNRVREALDSIGGLQNLVQPEMTVLLKPNLLSPRPPEDAVTTHPELVAAVGRLVQRCGGRVIIGDSPSSAVTDLCHLWDVTGMAAIAERDGFELVSFEKTGTVSVAIDTRVYHIARPAVQADLVINLPRLKTHMVTLLTGAVKNMFGVIPGFRKGAFHKEAPRPESFSRIIVDIFSAVQPHLTIMDAIVVMEGDGPSRGRPRRLGLLLASTDAVAVDAVAAEIVGVPAEDVPTTRLAAEAGLGIGWPQGIRIVGESIESVAVAPFQLTSNRRMEVLPPLIAGLLGPFFWMKPFIEGGKCEQCDACVDNCPTRAIARRGGGEPPRVDDELCITCWCCHEGCPSGAISIRKSWLLKRFAG